MSDETGNATSTWEALRRRKLVQWALAYAAGAWITLQVVSLVAGVYGWPPAVVRILTGVLMVGFPIALVLAWYHGERGVQRLSGPELLILAALMAIGGTLIARTERNASVVPATPATAAEPAAPRPAPAAIAAKSIAVLPFADLSEARDQEYFSDGMAEEILNALARVKDLKVAGRTSSFHFKGRNDDLRGIGQILGVANILEGSVRKQGDKVRITAQLIRTEDGFHRWSETYDGDLSDVFELQERIARAITQALQLELLGEQKERLVPVATTNPEAYALYLQASAIFNRRDGVRLAEAEAQLKQAIALDPGFARAHARLAALYVILPIYAGADVQSARANCVKYAASASALDPTLAEPWAALGANYGDVAGRTLESYAAFERAMELDSNDVTTNFWYGLDLLKSGYTRRGIALVDRALELDPLLPNGLRWRAILHLYAGQPAQAEPLLERARDVGLRSAYQNLADLAHARGDDAKAIEWWTMGGEGFFVGMPPGAHAKIAHGLFGDDAARAAALAMIREHLAATQQNRAIPGFVPVALVKLGRADLAMAAMRANTTNNNTDILILLWSPPGRALRALPEFGAFLDEFGFPSLWDRYGPPDICTRNASGKYDCT